MCSDQIEKNPDFILQVAAIFEENCLHLIQKPSDIERNLIFSANYCLDLLSS